MNENVSFSTSRTGDAFRDVLYLTERGNSRSDRTKVWWHAAGAFSARSRDIAVEVGST
jgi:hypothetical protein